jgi:NAD(P)-dependent dehydrogenase (short-subunit alcohol dehydrogenase family)
MMPAMRLLLLACLCLALGHASAGAQSVARTPSVPGPTTRIALVTGSTDGLGRELARRLAGEGAHVIVHGRNAARGEALVDEIKAGGKGSARFYRADFASLAEVRRLADEIGRDYTRLDLLVNNAGIFLRDERQSSVDGHELTFAVNYLAGYLLTHRLIPLLEKGRTPRIVNVSSRSAAPIDFGDVMLERGYTGYRAYSQSKLAQVMFTVDLATALQPKRIVVQAVHPATGMDTTLIATAGLTPRTSVDEGAAAVMHVIGTDAPSGSYFMGQAVAKPHAQATDPDARRQLRDVSRRLTSVP